MKNKNLLIFLIVCLIICIFSFFVSNLSAVNTIDDYAYVMAIGIDYSENLNREIDKNKKDNSNKINEASLKLSFQIAIPSSNGNKDSQSSASIINTVECCTIDDGINKVNEYISKKINLSYCKAIVFSKKVAQTGIGDIVSTLMNNIEIRPSCNIMVCENSPEDFLKNSKPLLEKLSSKYYEIERNSQKNTSTTEITTLIDFYNKYYDTFSEPCTILSTVEKDSKANSSSESNSDTKSNSSSESNSSSKNDSSSASGSDSKNIENGVLDEKSTSKIKSTGLAVFKKDKMVGELSADETICHLMLSNKLQHTIISIQNPLKDNSYISLDISNVKSNNKVDIYNNSPYITCTLNIKAKILSSSSNLDYMNKENLLKIEQATNEYITAQINSFLYKISHKYESDIVGFGSYAVRNFKTKSEWEKYDWLNQFRNSTYNVKVNTSIKSSYLVIN